MARLQEVLIDLASGSDTISPQMADQHTNNSREPHDPYDPGTAFFADEQASAPQSEPYFQDLENRYGVAPGVGPLLGEFFRVWAAVLPRLTQLFLGVAVIELVVDLVFVLAGQVDKTTGELPFQAGALMAFPLAIAAWAGAFIMLDERARFGKDVRGVGSLLGQGFRFFGANFGLSILMGLALLPAVIPGLIFFALEIYVVAVPLVTVGALFDIFLLVRWSIANVVVVTEGVGVSAALSRSSGLVKGYFWTTVGFLLVAAVIMIGGLSLVGVAGYLVTWAAGIPEIYGDLFLNFANTLVAGPLFYVAAFVLWGALKNVYRNT